MTTVLKRIKLLSRKTAFLLLSSLATKLDIYFFSHFSDTKLENKLTRISLSAFAADDSVTRFDQTSPLWLILKVFCNFLRVYFAKVNVLNLLWQPFYAIGKIQSL